MSVRPTLTASGGGRNDRDNSSTLGIAEIGRAAGEVMVSVTVRPACHPCFIRCWMFEFPCGILAAIPRGEGCWMFDVGCSMFDVRCFLLPSDFYFLLSEFQLFPCETQ